MQSLKLHKGRKKRLRKINLVLGSCPEQPPAGCAAPAAPKIGWKRENEGTEPSRPPPLRWFLLPSCSSLLAEQEKPFGEAQSKNFQLFGTGARCSPVFPGHFLQGDALLDGDVREVQHGHAQAFVFEPLDLLLRLQVPQGRDVVDEFRLPLASRRKKVQQWGKKKKKNTELRGCFSYIIFFPRYFLML